MHSTSAARCSPTSGSSQEDCTRKKWRCFTKSREALDGVRNHKGDINDGMLALYSIERVTHLMYEERYSLMCLSAKKNEK